jgi:hypothetical protein
MGKSRLTGGAVQRPAAVVAELSGSGASYASEPLFQQHQISVSASPCVARVGQRGAPPCQDTPSGEDFARCISHWAPAECKGLAEKKELGGARTMT